MWDATGRALYVDGVATHKLTASGEEVVDHSARPDSDKHEYLEGDTVVVRSPYDPTATATAVLGGCSGGTRTMATRAGAALPLTGTPIEAMAPDRWLPDGTLLFLDRGDSCDYSPGSLWAFRDGHATLISEGVNDTAVRTIPPG